ncbi:hypothetical protein [Arsukibacterium sp.]
MSDIILSAGCKQQNGKNQRYDKVEADNVNKPLFTLRDSPIILL